MRKTHEENGEKLTHNQIIEHVEAFKSEDWSDDDDDTPEVGDAAVEAATFILDTSPGPPAQMANVIVLKSFDFGRVFNASAGCGCSSGLDDDELPLRRKSGCFFCIIKSSRASLIHQPLPTKLRTKIGTCSYRVSVKIEHDRRC